MIVRPATACSVPGSAASVELTAASWRVPNGVRPAPVMASVTCACPSPVSGKLVKAVTDELSPAASTTAATPEQMTAAVKADRPGRENGAASPSDIGRGAGRRANARCTRPPAPAAGACPATMAEVTLSRPARTAGMRPASTTTAIMAAGAATVTHSGTVTGTWNRLWPAPIIGSAQLRPRNTPTTQPAAAGTRTCTR